MTRAIISNVSNQDKVIWKMTSNGRLPSILKVAYLSNYRLDLYQILDLGIYDQSKHFKCFRSRLLQIEDDLKWKSTFNLKSGISQQLKVRSIQNIRLRLL